MRLIVNLLIGIFLLISFEVNSQNDSDSLDFIPLLTKKQENAYLGIKTNLLYDLALAPNIEIEVLLNKFSLNFEYQFPWYVNTDERFAYQVLHVGLEGRYWIARQKVKQQRMPYTGAFIGLYYGFGLFDIQTSEEGIQGDIDILAGISGGYTIYLNRSFNLEFSLGLGYMSSDNKNYRAFDDLLLRRYRSKFIYYGPTKAKVSLVWFINNKNNR